jgi:hypothetical protein
MTEQKSNKTSIPVSESKTPGIQAFVIGWGPNGTLTVTGKVLEPGKGK